jgi:hypothetical protein
MDDREDTVGRLLEGTTNFSRAEREEIFDDVFAAVAAEEGATAPAPRTLPAWLRWFALAAVVCLAIVPASMLIDTKPEFVARGGSTTNLQLQCTGEVCALGDSLTFEVTGAKAPWFAAFGRSSSGTVVWYFPATDRATSVKVEDGLLDQGVKLGDEHSTGTWTVHALFSHAPLTRDAVKACFDEHGELQCDDVELLERTFTIQ